MNKCKNVHTPIFYERQSPKEHESEQLNPDKNGKIIDIGHKVIELIYIAYRTLIITKEKMDYNNKFILNCKPLNDQSAMEPLEFLSFTQFISFQF